ncbi:hypothetical protein ElyMa_000171600 [Elysia marginata]|uniref:Uncharacterized protein n=1 Tax=Elysia marginata TaxID=1093978 RepID=A0AAV4EU42_9GAST|nr:hypothetical protein ElyMa_000171600 [Elysia marginata]
MPLKAVSVTDGRRMDATGVTVRQVDTLNIPPAAAADTGRCLPSAPAWSAALHTYTTMQTSRLRGYYVKDGIDSNTAVRNR